MFDNWYDWVNPLNYVDYVWGNGSSVDAATDTLDNAKTLWKNNKSENQEMLDAYLSGVDSNKTANDKILTGYGSDIESNKTANENLLNSTYSGALQKYNDLMSKYENMGAYQAGNFSYGKDINDFMSPAMELRIKEAQNGITKSQANAGNMFSSDYLNALNAKSQAMASEEYDKAYDRMMQDRSNTLAEWQAQNAENKAAYDSQSNLYSNLISQYGNDRSNLISNTLTNNNNYLTNKGTLYGKQIDSNNSYLDELGNYYAQTINNNNAYTQGLTNLDTAKATAEASHDNGLSNALNFSLNAYNTFAAG